jgi:proline dehydrogenase
MGGRRRLLHARRRSRNAVSLPRSTAGTEAVAVIATASDVEGAVVALGTDLAARLPRARRLSPARAEQRLMELVMGDPALRAALFRFVDVRPACSSPAELTRHLRELLEEAEASAAAQRAAKALRRPLAMRPTAFVADQGVNRMAERFIIGEDAADALASIRELWRAGVATTVDLLGEATVTEPEADRYAARCLDTLRVLADEAERWPATPTPRVNLSVKVSALTTQLRALAPERGVEGARSRLRGLLRAARDLGAHLHVDMESFETRDAIQRLTLELLAEQEFAAGPSAGVVLQAYLTESPQHLDELLAWCREHPRATPLTVRLVKGAYWDHEMVDAAQHGWTSPVFADKRATDRNFERLTRVLLDATREGVVRTAIASHNLRSIAHAAAYADEIGLRDGLEFQILRGLGDDTQAALAAAGRPVRCYCPVGDLVAGMAYLVRRLLENTANDSFLAAQAGGGDLTTLLEAP